MLSFLLPAAALADAIGNVICRLCLDDELVKQG